jgi:hypothetical protein
MDYPHYSSPLTPSDLHLFGPLKKHSAAKHFAEDTNMKQAVTS